MIVLTEADMQYQGVQNNLNQKWAGRILSTRSMADEFRSDFWPFAFAEGRSYCRSESQCSELVEMMMNEFIGEYSRNPLPRDIYSEMIVKLGLLYGKTGGKEKGSAASRRSESAGFPYTGAGYSGYASPGNAAPRPGTAYGSAGSFDPGRPLGGYQAPSYREPGSYRTDRYAVPEQPYGEAWRSPNQGRPAEGGYSGYSGYSTGRTEAGFVPGAGNGYSRDYGAGNSSAPGYAPNRYAEPATMPRQPERQMPPVEPRAPGGYYGVNPNAPQGSPVSAAGTVPGAGMENGQMPFMQGAGPVPQMEVPAAPAPQPSGIPVQPAMDGRMPQANEPVQAGVQPVPTAGNVQPVQVPGTMASAQPVQAGQSAVFTAPVQTAMPVGSIPMSTTVSVQPVMQIPVQPVMQAPVQTQTSIPNLAGVQDILGMKGGADSPEAQNMLVQAARLIQAYNAATKSNVGELEEEESEEENEIVEADPSKAASWRPPKFGFSRKQKQAEQAAGPAEPKKKKQKEEPVKPKVEVPDAKPENNTTRKAEKVDDGKSSTFSVINTILLILTGASVLFLIWETGLIQKLL